MAEVVQGQVVQGQVALQRRPLIKCLVYGDPGAGKSTFAATFPKPMLVFAFDPPGKDSVYWDYGNVTELLDLSENSGIKGLEGVQVLGRKTGNPLIQIEYYLDEDPSAPVGASRFRSRMSGLHHHYSEFKTVVVDSVTFAEMTIRYYDKYKKNPGTKEPRQWFAASTDGVEELIGVRLPSLKTLNVVTICHVDEEKEDMHGHAIRTVKAPGRMRKGLPAAYAEVFRMYVQEPKSGETSDKSYWLQTQSSSMWTAASRMRPVPPNPCGPTYKALFGEE